MLTVEGCRTDLRVPSIDTTLHYLKDLKLWVLWYIPLLFIDFIDPEVVLFAHLEL